MLSLGSGISMLMVICTRFTSLLLWYLQLQSSIHFVTLSLRSWRSWLKTTIWQFSISSPLPASIKSTVSVTRHGCLLAVPILIVTFLDLSIRRITLILINALCIIATESTIIYLLRCISCVCVILLLSWGPYNFRLIFNYHFFEKIVEVYWVVWFLVPLSRCASVRGLILLPTVAALLIRSYLVPHIDELSIVIILIDHHSIALVHAESGPVATASVLIISAVGVCGLSRLVLWNCITSCCINWI